MDEQSLHGQMNELKDLGILTLSASRVWIVTHFKQRQSAEPTALRSRHYREFSQKNKFRHETATKRDADIDVDRDTDEEKESDVDEDETCGGGSPDDELVETFVKHTRIPLNMGGADLWARALERLAPCVKAARCRFPYGDGSQSLRGSTHHFLKRCSEEKPGWRA